ncbi:hypothetical protein [Actimicrobium sp. CCI2.3]|uniref:hypothetical protein n=1 Tax=Actimicrobium sp. CCI2.3 TaxID=3048616 RepID=UPI002AB392C4|nr:hypothetical protein [Actimicrobium sp. CCI2.3]MDY7574550.1 hypothetical protein [Actimicrobium sp. CCI2.3]MEB0020926.1 hypothetical protein [Actimicrobium sp. CCI2.3]
MPVRIESKLKKLEGQNAKRTAQKTAIDERLANPKVYDNANRNELKTLLTDQANFKKELAELEVQWIERQKALEQIV